MSLRLVSPVAVNQTKPCGQNPMATSIRHLDLYSSPVMLSGARNCHVRDSRYFWKYFNRRVARPEDRVVRSLPVKTRLDERKQGGSAVPALSSASRSAAAAFHSGLARPIAGVIVGQRMIAIFAKRPA